LFRAATELAPGNPKAFYNLGGVYAVQGKNKEAEAILLQAIAIRPAAGAYSNLGTVLRAEGRYADSAAMLEKAVELVPNDYRLWQNLGNAYVLADNREQADKAYLRAVEEIQKALVLSPHDNQLLGALALNYANLQQKKNAMLALQKLSGPSAQTPDVLFNSALVYELVGERARALSALQAAVRAGLPETRIQSTSTFDRLRADARYNRVVAVQVRLSK
jgi:Flp pilus assembly protein TadD